LRRFLYLSLASLASCATMLFAAFVAEAGSPVRVAWMIPQEVSQTGVALSSGPQMAVDMTGTLHLIWMDDTPGQADLYYIKSADQGITWSDSEYVATPLESEDGSLTVDSTGRVHACWCEQSYEEYRLRYAQRTASGWSLQATAVVTDSEMSYPAIAEAAGDLHVVWSNKPSYDGPSLYYIRKPTSGGAWSDAAVVADTAPASLYTKMAVDTSDNLHVVWQEYSSPYEIMYVSGTVGTETTWSAPITISAALPVTATIPDIHVDSSVHIVFGVDVEGQEDTQDVYYVNFPVGSTGSISPTVIPGSRVEVSQELPTWASPSIASDGAGILHVVWNGMKDGDSYDRIYHVMSDDQGASWSQPMAISPDDAWPDGFPFIVGDGNLVHVAWQQKGLGTDNDIYYSHSLPVSTLLPLALKGYS
jgi:hypothetical protein